MDVLAANGSLDLREVAEPEKGTRLLGLFDTLRPGERLVLLEGSPAAELLVMLQAERKGLFEWTPRKAGDRWEVEVARRDAERGALRGINEALSWDHDRLDALEKQAFEARAAGEWPAAAERFALFAAGLERHIGFEEDLLFPAFEACTGMPPHAGPTAVMRHEHREIRAILAAIAECINRPGTRAEELRRGLHAVLSDHNTKEERILYPGADRMLSRERADRLVAEIQAYAPA